MGRSLGEWRGDEELASGLALVIEEVSKPVTPGTVDFLPVSPFFLSNKSLVGNVFGLTNPLADMPRILEHYRAGNKG